jgi:hypothetical protein
LCGEVKESLKLISNSRSLKRFPPAEIASSLNNHCSSAHGTTSGAQVVPPSSDVLPSSAYGLISSSGDVTVDSLQADPAQVSDSAAITLSVTAPVFSTVSPRPLFSHLRDEHRPVARSSLASYYLMLGWYRSLEGRFLPVLLE